MEEVKKAGLETPRINVIGKLKSSHGKEPVLVLDSHTDTVPAGSGWSVDPFGGIIKDGKIYGRGASDCKGGLASMTAAMDALVRSEIEFEGTVIITATVDDEIAGTLGARYLLEKGYIKPTYAIVGEGSQSTTEPKALDVVTTFGGRTWIKMATKGKAAHGGAPHLGINAIDKMIKVILAVEKELKIKPHPLYPGTINLGTIRGGTKTNVVPDYCEATFDIRFGPGETVDNILNKIGKIVEKIQSEDPELTVTEITPFERREAFEVPPEHELVKTLTKHIVNIVGKPPKYVGTLGSGNAYHYWDVLKAPAVFFGPGYPPTLHKPDEYVEIDMLKYTTKIYVLTALDLCKPLM